MAVLPIRVAPDPVLRSKSKRIKAMDGSLRRLIEDMRETMHEAPGVGLAAPQVGVPVRLIVIGLPDEEDIVLVNPEVVRRSGERLLEEGCVAEDQADPGLKGLEVVFLGRNLRQPLPPN